MANRLTVFLRDCRTAIHTLSLYGAAAIASYGWALGRLLHFPTRPYLPLWFAGALFVYNIDRLKADPSDKVNTPRRYRESLRLRPAGALAAALAACALILLPIFSRDWVSLLLTAGGGIVCLSYSVPFLGFRLKDVPLLKTFFAPTLVTAAYFVLPRQGAGTAASAMPYHLLAAGWTWVFLLFNMILCDLRDLEGDRRMRTRSLPVTIGARWTLRTLGGLLGALAILSLFTAWRAPPEKALLWEELGAVSVLYLGGLLAAARKPKPESFYEWWVEGMLFLPALVVLGNR